MYIYRNKNHVKLMMLNGGSYVCNVCVSRFPFPLVLLSLSLTLDMLEQGGGGQCCRVASFMLWYAM